MRRFLAVNKFLALIGLCAAFSFSVRAQTIAATGNLTAQDSGNCTTANACLVGNLKTTSASAVVQISGTFSATVQFEASTVATGPYTAIQGTLIGGTSTATSATAPGAWRFNVASLNFIRVRCSAYTSGTVTVAITSSNASSVNAGMSGGGGGPPTGAAGGDLTGTYPNPGVGQVNGAAVPASAGVAGTNSAGQIIAAAAAAIVGQFSGCSGVLYLGADGACHSTVTSASSPLVLTGTNLSCPTCGTNTGNVVGPNSSTTNDAAIFGDTTGKVLADGGGPLPATLANASHQWLNSYTKSTGLFTQTQPGFSDLSGSAACGQMPALTGDTTTSAGSCSTTTAALRNIALPTLAASTGYLYDLAGVLSLSTSASNLTSGTLPHAQLPALLSADIPNNAANTSGTAAALGATPSTCGAGVAATGILANGNATGCFTPSGVAPGFLTTTYINSTTTFSNVPGWSFSVAANTNYGMTCRFTYQENVNAEAQLQITGPASPTTVEINFSEFGANYSGPTYQVSNTTSFFTPVQTGQPCYSAGSFGPCAGTLTMTLINGSNAGTVQVQAAAGTNGTNALIIYPGYCKLN